ncbi:MAG: hypothetical protein SFY80_00810 [Verrucomicrobiota bacterium]|nr:hypothetical protein [Verrucomicrobiota bacterium]
MASIPPHLRGGAGQFKSDAGDMASGAGIGFAAKIATGSSVAGAAMGSLGGVIVNRVLGPLGLVSGMVLGIVSGLRAATRQTDLLGRGISSLRSLETLKTQFVPLLKSVEAAKQRIASLYKFAASTPFQLGEIGNANRTLEVLTRGLYSSEEAMKKIGDAAAVSGRSLEETSFWVGRLYDALKNNAPIGEAVLRLGEMGIVSFETRRKIEDLQAAGADFGATWRLVERDLGRAEGGMLQLSKTLGGLESTLSDARAMFAGAFGESFFEGEKKGVEASIRVMENFTPVVAQLGKEFATYSEPVKGFWNSVVKGNTVLGGLATASKVAVSALGALVPTLVAMQTQAAAAGLKNLAGFIGLSFKGASKDAAKFAAHQDAVNAAMERGTVGGKAYGLALRASGGAARMLGSSLMSVWTAAKPLLPGGALILGATLVTRYFTKAAEAAQAWSDRNVSIGESLKKVDTEAGNIRSIDDYYSTLTGTLKDLGEAYKKLNELRASGADLDDIKQQFDLIDGLERRINKIRSMDSGTLAKSKASIDQDRTNKQMLKDREEVQFQGQFERASDQDKIAMLRARGSMIQGKLSTAEEHSKGAPAAAEFERQRQEAKANIAMIVGQMERSPMLKLTKRGELTQAKARLAEIEANPPTEAARLRLESERLTEGGKPGAGQVLAEQARDLDMLVQEMPQLSRELAEITESEKSLTQAYSRRMDDLKAELQSQREILAIKQEGIAATRKESAAVIKMLDAKMKLARAARDEAAYLQLSVQKEEQRASLARAERSAKQFAQDADRKYMMEQLQRQADGGDEASGTKLGEMQRQDIWKASYQEAYSATGDVNKSIQLANRSVVGMGAAGMGDAHPFAPSGMPSLREGKDPFFKPGLTVWGADTTKTEPEQGLPAWAQGAFDEVMKPAYEEASTFVKPFSVPISAPTDSTAAIAKVREEIVGLRRDLSSYLT